MPFSVIEDMYEYLTLEKQQELYDYLCFLVSKSGNLKSEHNSKNTYSKEFFTLFGKLQDSSFVEPEDSVELGFNIGYSQRKRIQPD